MRRILQCFSLAYRRHHFCTFSGTASREEFWYFVLTWFILNSVIVAAATSFAWASFGDMLQSFYGDLMPEDGVPFSLILCAGAGLAYFVFMLISIVPATALAVRRYHDAGLSGMLFAVLAFGSPACTIFVMIRFWAAMSGMSDMLLADADNLLETSLSAEIWVLFFAQLLGFANIVCLALPSKAVLDPSFK